jgi:hypothetical protein
MYDSEELMSGWFSFSSGVKNEDAVDAVDTEIVEALEAVQRLDLGRAPGIARTRDAVLVPVGCSTI